MRVFVPMPDEWNSGAAFAGEALVPYRCGLAVWREPAPPPAPEPEPAEETPRPRFSAAA